MIKKAIISGGGTGGHIFPAIAIADRIKKECPDADILFIGAEGKMEMEKVPAAGYKIIGLPIRGFQRKFDLSNFILPFRLVASLWKARNIIKSFQPNVVIGVGGYASGPTLQIASMLRIPTIVQEQNSFAGKTNIILGKKVSAVCVAYDGMEKFFPKEKIVITGNPVRRDMITIEGKREEAINYFQLDPTKKTILVVGGSLGARSLNEAVINNLEKIDNTENVQLIWQCGKVAEIPSQEAIRKSKSKNVHLHTFISRMDLAYAAADLVISRAGAIAVSELCAVGKPTILVPSPYVAEDHQTKNALALVEKEAAILVEDKNANELFNTAFSLLKDDTRLHELQENCKKLGISDADERIVATIKNIL